MDLDALSLDLMEDDHSDDDIHDNEEDTEIDKAFKKL